MILVLWGYVGSLVRLYIIIIVVVIMIIVIIIQ